MSVKQKASKAERIEAAREEARQVREQHVKARKRKKIFTALGSIIAIVAVLVVVALVLVNSTAQQNQVSDVGAAPTNVNNHGGVILENKSSLKQLPSIGEVDVRNVSDDSEQASKTPPGILAATPATGQKHQVVLYVDMQCPGCASFETVNGQYVDQLAEGGAVDVEYRVVGFLDSQSRNMYSTRAANAMYCVADKAPGKYNEYMKKLFKEQPRERSSGPSNDELARKAEDIGAQETGDCIRNEDYKTYVKYVTDKAAFAGVAGTPTAYVDGQVWNPGGNAFPAFANAVDAQAFPPSESTNLPSGDLSDDIKIEQKK